MAVELGGSIGARVSVEGVALDEGEADNGRQSALRVWWKCLGWVLRSEVAVLDGDVSLSLELIGCVVEGGRV